MADAATNVRLIEVTLTEDSEGKASASAMWRVDYNADDIGTYQAITLAQAYSGGVPLTGTTYNLEGDTYDGLYLKSLTSRRRNVNSGERVSSQFEITGSYSTPDSGSGGGDQNPNPLLRPTKKWLEFETETRQVTQGWLQTALPKLGTTAGQPGAIGHFGPLVNSVGVRFEDALYEDRQQVYYIQQKNFFTLGEIYGLVDRYDHTVNKGAFLGFPKHCAKFCGVAASPPIEVATRQGIITYYEGTIRIALSREPFYVEVVNCGTRDETGAPYLDDEPAGAGAHVTEPVNLTLAGTRITDPKVPATTISYRTRKEVSYLGLIF